MDQIIVPVTAGVLALITTLIVKWYNYQQEKNNHRRAVAGEISSLIKLIKTRKYLKYLDEWIEDIQNGKELTRKSFISNPNYDYFIIYESNIDKVGLLPSKSTEHVVQFYTLLKSLLEDTVNEELYDRPKNKILETLEENRIILKEIIKEGKLALKELS